MLLLLRCLAPGALVALIAGACVPNVGKDAVPYAMEFDAQSKPPRVPQPTSLVVNPATRHIDFSLAGTPLPADCTTSQTLSEAECEFDKYLEALDGFPTVTPAAAPTTAPGLDATSLSVGENVVVMAAKARAPVTDVTVGFDEINRALTVRPRASWHIGELYWVGVRGYDHGVRATDGSSLVGSPTQYLLKQETSLSCGATDAANIPSDCPAFLLLSQGQPSDPMTVAALKANLFQLEAIRVGYQALGGWDLMAAAGLPKSDIAVLWSFPIHTSSVAELDPTAGLVPAVTVPDEIRVAVQGSVEPSTVTPLVFMVNYGSVVLLDTTALAAGSLVAGFPAIDASFVGGAILIKAHAPLVAGHDYAIFVTDAVHDAGGNPLVPSPISVLLKLRTKLLDADGKSAISTVGDSDATMLEVNRVKLAMLFDTPGFTALSGISREKLVYCFGFTFGAP